jgi:PTS system ascorbate-specific IIA component
MENKEIGTKIKELLKLENVRIISSVPSWQEAVKVSVTPLIEQGYCEERYIEGIIENTFSYGPYYVLCENMALIHAEASKGVNRTQVAITVLKNPIKFKQDGLDVRVLIALGAVDAEGHLSVMQAISKIFSNEKKVKTILQASSPDVIYDEFVTSVTLD